MGTTPARPAATADLVEQIASAQHSIARSWHYDPTADRPDGPEAAEPPRLSPWLEPTADPNWLHTRRPLVDVANTWWEDLPADWRQRFRAVAGVAADAIVRETAEGRGAGELDTDRLFVTATAQKLGADWLRAPRVHPLDRTGEIDGAPQTLVRVAIRTYVGWLGGKRELGSIPSFPPLEERRKTPRRPTRTGSDRKHVSFRLIGRRLDPHRMSELTGLRPRHAHRFGQLNLSRPTGMLVSPYRNGLWSVTTDGELDEVNLTLRDHLVWLLDRLEPHAPEIRDLTLAHDLTADFFCGYFQGQWNSSWELDALTLGRIAKLGASLGYDSYADADADESVQDLLDSES